MRHLPIEAIITNAGTIFIVTKSAKSLPHTANRYKPSCECVFADYQISMAYKILEYNLYCHMTTPKKHASYFTCPTGPKSHLTVCFETQNRRDVQ